MTIDGIFNINKPSGMTSFDVVSAVRRLTKQRRVGHAGTLDPAAVGVLPVCVGQATKVVEYLTEATKAYCAEITLGVSTDTFDIEGRILSERSITEIDLPAIEKALAEFRGSIEQLPPMYSAVKISGKRLYELARAGQEIERTPRKVHIFEISLVAWEPPSLVIKVECSKGTYIRSLANDLGELLGCGAFLRHLVRLRSGPFTIREAIGLEELAEAFRLAFWQSQIYSPDEVLLNWPAAILGDDKEKAIRRGQNVRLDGTFETDTSRHEDNTLDRTHYCRAYSEGGTLIGILRLERPLEMWHPEKVFPLPHSHHEDCAPIAVN